MVQSSENKCDCDCSKCINCEKRTVRTSYLEERPPPAAQGITISEVPLRNFRPGFYFMKETLSTEHNRSWIFSTVISRHVCCNKEWFAEYTECKGSVVVDLFGGSVPILGTGTVHLLTDEGNVVTLHHVRHVPGATLNAISVGSLVSFGYNVVISAGIDEAFRPDYTSMMLARRRDVLCYVCCTTLVRMNVDPDTKEIARKFKNHEVGKRPESTQSGGGVR